LHTARICASLARLREDGKRFFRWSTSDWNQIEPKLAKIIDSATRSQIKHRGESVQCYQWRSTEFAGRKSRGRMLLCHGWEGYAFNFAALIAAAVDAGWEVIAFDHLSHGDSGGTQSGLPIALSTLIEVASSAGPVDVLVGHSLGGAASVWATANGKVKTKKLVLLAPFYDTSHLTRLWAKAHFLADHFLEGLQAELEAMAELTFEDFMPHKLGPQIATPTLIIHDPKDPVTGFKHSKKLAALNENVTLTPAEKMGHIRLLADAEHVAQMMKFASDGK
jgi:pimeloyl-ACP methyl ester carboxylesterase